MVMFERGPDGRYSAQGYGLSVAGYRTQFFAMLALRRAWKRQQHDHPEPPPWRRLIAVTLVIGTIWFAGSHLENAQATRNDPPATCQLLGGSWNPWSGWNCQ